MFEAAWVGAIHDGADRRLILSAMAMVLGEMEATLIVEGDDKPSDESNLAERVDEIREEARHNLLWRIQGKSREG